MSFVSGPENPAEVTAQNLETTGPVCILFKKYVVASGRGLLQRGIWRSLTRGRGLSMVQGTGMCKEIVDVGRGRGQVGSELRGGRSRYLTRGRGVMRAQGTGLFMFQWKKTI